MCAREGGIIRDRKKDEAQAMRQELANHYREHAAVAAAWAARSYSYPPPVFPKFPAHLRGLKCGASTKAGTPCKLAADYANGRCKLHGGPSTGPKTEAGRRQSAENGKKGGRPRRNLTP